MMSSYTAFEDKENNDLPKIGNELDGNDQPPKKGLRVKNDEPGPLQLVKRGGKQNEAEIVPFPEVQQRTRKQKANVVFNNGLQENPLKIEKCKLGKSTFAIHKDVEDQQKAEDKLNQEGLKFEDVKQVNAEPSKAQDEVFADISHLRIPDSIDTDSMATFEADTSFGSPMSIHESMSTVRRRLNQEIEDSLFNVDEYDFNIYEYFMTAELKYRPKPGYMKKQPDIDYGMRAILVDWLVEVADEYKLATETLFLAVSYIDRFLSYMSVVKGKLQLVGTAAIFIASKFEEIFPPSVAEFVYVTDDTYTKRQVLKMENLILKVLCFGMSVPTISSFALKYCLASDSPKNVQLQHLTQYLCELSLLDGANFLGLLPSEIGAAATALARHTLRLEPWPQNLQDLTDKTLYELLPCLTLLASAFTNAATSPLQAVRTKYSTSKWSSVSELTKNEDEIFVEEEMFKDLEVTLETETSSEAEDSNK